MVARWTMVSALTSMPKGRADRAESHTCLLAARQPGTTAIAMMATAKMPSAKRATAMMATAMMVGLQLAASMAPDQAEMNQALLDLGPVSLLVAHLIL